MDDVFQEDAFQNDAFQMDVGGGEFDPAVVSATFQPESTDQQVARL